MAKPKPFQRFPLMRSNVFSETCVAHQPYCDDVLGFARR